MVGNASEREEREEKNMYLIVTVVLVITAMIIKSGPVRLWRTLNDRCPECGSEVELWDSKRATCKKCDNYEKLTN